MAIDLQNILNRLTWYIFGTTMRRGLYEEMGRLFESVPSVPIALDMLYDTYTDKVYDVNGNAVYRKKNNAVALVIDSCRNAMNNGYDFTEGFRGFFPDLEIDIIRAGAVSGRLSQSCEDLVKILDSRLAGRAALLRMAYPVFMMFIIIVSLQQLYKKMIPMLINLYDLKKWDGEALWMYWMSYICFTYFIPIVIGLVCIIALYIYSLPRMTGRLRIFLDRFPPYSVYRLWTGVGFLFTVSALHRANIPIRDIVVFSLENASPYLEERLRPVLRFLSEGDNLGEAFSRIDAGFPDNAIIRHLKMYAETKGYDEAIHIVSSSWLTRSVKAISAQANILSMVSIGMVALVMGIILIGFYQIQNLIGLQAIANTPH